MKKSIELNQEILRKRFLEIFNEYPKPSSIKQMKEIATDYDEVRELLDESLNVSIGIMQAIANKELKDKKEIQQLIKEITNELTSKNYL
jgi:hypothetical protein